MSTLRHHALPATEALAPHTRPLVSGPASKQWQQVLTRDLSADGQFFYAVKTTRIP